MKLDLEEILSDFKDEEILSKLVGNNIKVTGIASVESFQDGDLVFIGSKKFAKQLGDKTPTAVVVSDDTLAIFEKKGIPCLFAKNVNLAQALLKQKYLDRDFSLEGWGERHPSALVHETAQIGKNVTIGPFVTIAADAQIGDDTIILSHVIIEHGAVIGKNCVLHPRANIGYDCVIGNKTIIKQGAVIGSEGFGFAQDEKKRNHRIPQIGNVVIGDNVVIGALNTIERAAYTQTKIGNRSVFDTHCHVAHGVQIGENCILMAASNIAGSTVIGDRVIMSGQTGILDHLTICDDAILLHRAGVTRSVKEPGIYAFMPLVPLQSYLKSSLQLGNLHEMKKKISQLEKKLVEKDQA